MKLDILFFSYNFKEDDYVLIDNSAPADDYVPGENYVPRENYVPA
jgi:hypothetical protein